MGFGIHTLRNWLRSSVLRASAISLGVLVGLDPSHVEASGSYRHSALPQSGLNTMDEGLDVDRFELGRRLYAGMLRLPEMDAKAAAEQGDRLQALAKRLPSSQSKSADRVVQFAGRLSGAQMEALEYFVTERFLGKSAGKRKAA
ncbi:MAG: hypothetical protein JNN07_29240 [Verrucomicrobiales bacterium]|nr:hypothetical protein [Verrucomicrobiales bacterium]